MPSPVRVLGPADLAQPVHAALRSAGVEADFVTDAAVSAAAAPVAAGTVDVVCLAGSSDAAFVIIKRADPARPVVAVGTSEHSLLSLLDSGWADSRVVWPATPAALVEGIAEAAKVARRPSYLRWPSVLRGAQMGGFLIAILPLAASAGAMALKGAAAILAGLGFLLGARYQRRPRWSLLTGIAALLFGLVTLAKALGAYS